MVKYKQLIEKCFRSWISKDLEAFLECFSDSISYSESYGPEYRGIDQVEKWFIDWNRHGRVISWHIKQIIHQDLMAVVEWFFECDYKGTISGFDEVSIIHVDTNGKITMVKEFQSKAEHYFPYGTQ